MAKNRDFSKFPNAITVLDNGNVGIGNSNPSYRLSVNGDIASIGGTYYLQRSSASAVLPVIRYWDGNGSPMTGGALGDILTIGTQGTNELTFATDNTRRLTISTGGNVSIGTTAPAASTFAHLFVGKNISMFSGSGTDIYFGSNFYYDGSFKYRNSEAAAMINTNEGAFIFQNTSSGTANGVFSGVERMRITNTGRVGIGTSSPVGPLDIAVPAVGSAIAATNTQQAYDYSRLRIKHYTDSNLGLSIGYAGANYTYIQACYNEGTAAPLFINPFGSNTAVGTTSARARLDVGGAIMTLYQASTIADKAAGIFCESTGAGLSTGFGFVIQDGFAFQGDNAASNRKLSVRKPTANGSLGDLVAYIDSAAGNSWFAGRMERPNQPAFQANRGAAGNQSLNGDSNILEFTTIVYDNSSSYNNTTFRFTAPVAGCYLFTCMARYDNTSVSNSYIRTYFTVNGASGVGANYNYGHQIMGPSGGYSTSYHSGSISAVLKLQAGDYVNVRGGVSSATTGLQFESQFSGFLI